MVRFDYFAVADAEVVKVSALSAWNTASSLPVAAARPVPAAPPAAAPIRAPLGPPKTPPRTAPAAVPPPILIALLLVWLLPLARQAAVAIGVCLPSTSTDVSRNDSSPGACNRPLGLT